MRSDSATSEPIQREGRTSRPKRSDTTSAETLALSLAGRNATEAVGDVEPGESKVSWDEFAAAMDDDLNVSPALAAVFDLVRETATARIDKERLLTVIGDFAFRAFPNATHHILAVRDEIDEWLIAPLSGSRGADLPTLEQGFEPRPLRISGLGLHRYLGGPWEPLGIYKFRGVR